MNSLKKNKLLILVSVIILAGFIGYSYVFKEADTTENTKVVFNGTSKELIKEINQNANQLITKAVIIEGEISDINGEGVVIDNTVFCQFTNTKTLEQLKKHQSIKVKGIIIGYDDLLNELKLNQCIIKN